MPLHFPHVGHQNHRRHDAETKDNDSYIPTSPESSRSNLSPQRHATVSSTTSSESAPPSILKKSSTSASDSTSASGYLSKRKSGLTTFDGTDTISSTHDSDDEREGSSSVSTPATSVSSLNNQCPLPASSAGQKFPFFVMTLSSTSTLSFIALPVTMRPIVLNAIRHAWRKGVSKMDQVEYLKELMEKHKENGCDGGVWEVTMKDNCWMPNSQDKVSSKRILINLMTAFAREGYSMTSSFRTSAKDSGKDSLVFLRGEPDPDPIFFAVSFYSHDRVWIIDAEADVGEALEDSIKNGWFVGIQGVRTRERHCREIRLRGNPWTAHTTSSLISARCIHLLIMKSITHFDRGYDFVGSVDMADLDEGEMPVTFYRKKWGASRAVWKMAE